MSELLDETPSRSQSRGQDLPEWRWIRSLRRAVSILFTLGVISVVVLLLFLLYLRAQALPVISITQTSQIVDLHGDIIDSFNTGQNRQIITLDQISPMLIKATVAIEDHRFYDHHGFDMKGIARAAWVDVLHLSSKQGASTLTQQLAKNLYLTNEKTWNRKIKEALYTIQLEMQYSKDEILAQYLNQIYYGHGAYGIQAASRLYFDKDALNLDLAESAMIAGIPKAWKYYSPFMDFAKSKARQETILQTMVGFNEISQSEADAAYKETLHLKPLTDKKPDHAPYFSDYIRKLAVEKLGINENLMENGGITIYTTLDLKAQQIAEEAVAKQLAGNPEIQAALIAIDPRNGYIKAMVGGQNYKENQFNRVFANTRQPGSSFKPILYLTALQNNDFSAVTRFKSIPTVFTYDNGRNKYMPSNFGGHYANDFIDLRQAISQSDNIYAVNTIMKTGADQVIAMAHRLGIYSEMKPLPSLALGTFPVSPYEMAAAFSVIANQGVRVTPTAILRIVSADGKILYEASPQQEKVVDPATTYVLTTLMESVFDQGGTASRVAPILKRPAAGKTGTTNTDAWMVGFTPELSTAVWVGYDRDRKISAVESRKAAPIFAEFTERTLEAIPPKVFPVPDGVVNLYIDPTSGKLAGSNCSNSRMEAFVIGSEPLEYCSEPLAAPDSGETSPDSIKKNSSWWADLKRWWNE